MSTLCGILDSRNDKEGKLMDKCEEMRAQFDRFCDGQLTDSGTTQIQAISSLQMKNIRTPNSCKYDFGRTGKTACR